MKSIFNIFPICITLLCINSAKAICHNCNAEVVIKNENAEKFTEHLLLLSSMPLQGIILSASIKEGYTLVRVETYQEYADSNNIDSFDVAKRITSGFTQDSDWGIKEVRAVVEIDSASLSNVGTIGH